MALYAGETVRLRCTATDFDGNAITDADVEAATARIFDTNGDEVGSFPMTYDSTHGYFFYDWTTEAGTFKVRFTLQGATFETFEYATLRVKSDLVGA